MTPLVHELAVDGYPVAVTCRVLKVSTSTYYDWLKGRPPSSWDLSDAYLLDAIIDIHRIARGTYGVRQVTPAHLGPTAHVLPAAGGAADAPARPARVHRRRWRHGHRSPAVFQDLVKRQFTAVARRGEVAG